MTTVYDHPDYLTQLAGIIAMSEDDVRRLVLADWLDEHGETDRAEFIRVQVELAKYFEPHDWNNGGNLRQRQLVLFTVNHHQWFRLGYRWDVELSDEFAEMSETYDRLLAIVRRGFPSEVRCTLTDWIGETCHHCDGRGETASGPGWRAVCSVCQGNKNTTGVGPELVTSHPIQVVRLTDREPEEIEGQALPFVWWDQEWMSSENVGAAYLPTKLFNLLPGDSETHPTWMGESSPHKHYTTRDDAMAAKSVALIAWAKSQWPNSAV